MQQDIHAASERKIEFPVEPTEPKPSEIQKIRSKFRSSPQIRPNKNNNQTDSTSKLMNVDNIVEKFAQHVNKQYISVDWKSNVMECLMKMKLKKESTDIKNSLSKFIKRTVTQNKENLKKKHDQV